MRKLVTLSVALLIVCHPAFSQRAKYSKFYLSAGYGVNYDLKNPYPENLGPDILMSCTGAYFFTPNVGLGLNYHFNQGSKIDGGNFFSRGYGDTWVSTEDFPFTGVYNSDFKESIHYFGGSIFGRLYLGKSDYHRAKKGYGRRMVVKSMPRWMLQANIGIGWLWLKQYDFVRYFEYGLVDPSSGYAIPPPEVYYFNDYNKRVVGFTAAAGIHYRIISFMGIGVTADGLFGNEERWGKCQRIGVLAGLEFYF
ncbi:MAG: hypothetical protein LBT50_00725 [Prevotellaceae bacterium]|nr:hypothetical protein [Prevotellaceae bacterium]